MPPTERSPEHTADNRPEDVGGTKRKTLRPAVVISVPPSITTLLEWQRLAGSEPVDVVLG